MQPWKRLKHFNLFSAFIKALLVLLLGGFCTRLQVYEPSTGALWSSVYGIVYYVAPGSPAATKLLHHDRILKIDGIPFQKSTLRFDKPQPDNFVVLEIERLGEVLIVELFYTRYSMWFLNLLPIVTASTFWVLSIAVLAFKPTNNKAILFFLYCQILSALLATGGVDGHVWVEQLFVLLTWWALPIGIHFHFLFPVPALTVNSRRFLIAIYILAFLGSFLYILSGRPIQNRLPNELHNAYLAFGFCWLTLHPLLIIYLLVRAYRETTRKEIRRQVGLVAFSGLTAFTPFLMLCVLPHVLIGAPLLPYQVAFLFFLAIPLGYGVAIFRFQFIRLEHHINRSTTLFLVITLLCGLYLTTHVLLSRFFSADLPRVSITNLALVMLPVLAFRPLYRRLRLLADHLLYGGWYDYPSVVGEVSLNLQSGKDVESMIQILCQTIQKTMRVYWACLLLPNKSNAVAIENQEIEVSWFDSVQLSANSPIIQYLQTHNRPIASLELHQAIHYARLSSDEVQLLTHEDTRLLIPISGRHGSLAILILGPKYGDDLFDENDYEILSVVARQASYAFQNAQLITELEARAWESSQYQRRALHAREQERKHLANELHDEIIQALVGIKFEVYGLQELLGESNDQVVKVKEKVGDLIGNTRRICRGFRPPALDLGLIPVLRSLIHETRLSTQLDIKLSVYGNQDQALDEDLVFSLFRFMQESLVNVKKHADARQVLVRLEIGREQLSLRVKDDGRGFVVPERLGDLMKKNHFGLVGLRERLELVNGTLHIRSALGQGTTLCALVPRKPQKPSAFEEEEVKESAPAPSTESGCADAA